MLYYLDIETFSPSVPNPKKDKILSIQFCPLDFKGNVCGDLTILKEWEKGEEEIVRIFNRILERKGKWGFVPVGYNLNFEWRFLYEKFRKYSLPQIDFLSRPYLDLMHTALLMNGRFKGCKLSAFTSKKEDGGVIARYYKKGRFDLIEDYILDEAQAFCSLYKKLCRLRFLRRFILL